MLETGGSVGASIARRLKRPPADLAATGIAAAFAAAYHAPVGAYLYVQEHVVHRPLRRTLRCALAGAVIGFLIADVGLGGNAIFAHGIDPLGAGAFERAAIGLVPALAATRLFFWIRKSVAAPGAPSPESVRVWVRSLAFALAAGAIVAFVPLTSGNGMEAIRHGLTDATIGVALALTLGKLAATCAAIGSGAPGGVFSPSMAVAAGAALLSYEFIERTGVSLAGSHWDGMLAAMAIGVAVGTGTPLVGIVIVSELAGDARLLPICALSVGGARLIEEGVKWIGRRRVRPTPSMTDALLDA